MAVRTIACSLLVACCAAWAGAPASAHVPYLEWSDLTETQPFVVIDVEQSKAVYAWTEQASDVDYYVFEVSGPTDLYFDLIVPVCAGYEEYRPSFAVIGPGLPEPAEAIPVELYPGYGAIVRSGGEPGEPRETFYEPFGGKSYYQGPVLDQVVSEPGWWGVVVWDPAQGVGDYVAAIGKVESFSFFDILRSLVNTIIIRVDGELHTSCD